MEQYQYLPLEDDTHIRLVTILPGNINDPIRAEIRHEPLILPKKGEYNQSTLREISEALTEDWGAYETLEERFIFYDRETDRTSWTHPDPIINNIMSKAALEGKIDTTSIAYEALSYAWGSTEKDETIEIDIHETMGGAQASSNSLRRQLPVTSSLAVALQHIRFCDRPRTMWIDAICINQDDVQERSAQVQRMGDIFSLASRVVIWLGPSFVGSRLAFSALKEFGEQVIISKGLIWFLPSPDCRHPDWYRNETKVPFSINEITAITQLCKLAYWRRVWIVQEIVLASAKSIIKCGSEEISLPLFRNAIACLYGKEWSTDIAAALTKVDRILTTSEIPFSRILYQQQGRRCTDARDKVYGCINIVDPALREHIIVDYSKSSLDVYKQVFLAFLDQDKRLAQLPFAKKYSSPDSPWPTWVPNWSLPGFSISLISIVPNASSVSAARAKYKDLNRLEVTGMLFARVSVESQHWVQDTFLEMVESLKALGLDDLQTSIYPTGEMLLDAYIQNLSLGGLRENIHHQSPPPLSEVREDIMTLACGPQHAKQSVLAKQYFGQLRLPRCHLFNMSNGYVGVAEGSILPGDEVFIILGCDCPMILRPHLDGTYEVVRDCYIHGVMNGEALLGGLPCQWEAKRRQVEDRRFWVLRFYDRESGAESEYDPRLENITLPPEWEPIEFEWTPSDPANCRKFRNRDTGEIINSDPRLFPEALIERGVPLKTITLV